MADSQRKEGTEREIARPLLTPQMPTDCHSQADLKPQARSSFRVSAMGAGAQSLGPCSAFPVQEAGSEV